MTPAMIFDYSAVHFNPDAVADKRYTLNVNLTDRNEDHGLWVENSVLHAVPRRLSDADVTLRTDKNILTALCMGLLPLEKAVADGKLTVEGSTAVLKDFLGSLEASPAGFPIVTP